MVANYPNLTPCSRLFLGTYHVFRKTVLSVELSIYYLPRRGSLYHKTTISPVKKTFLLDLNHLYSFQVLVKHLQKAVTELFPDQLKKLADKSDTADPTTNIKSEQPEISGAAPAIDIKKELLRNTITATEITPSLISSAALKKYETDLMSSLEKLSNCVMPKRIKLENSDDDDDEIKGENGKTESKNNSSTDTKPPFFYHESTDEEKLDLASAEIRLPSKAPIANYAEDSGGCSSSKVDYCLSLSNVIRGLAFVPGNELEMVRNAELMALYSNLLLVLHEHCRFQPKKVQVVEEKDEEQEVEKKEQDVSKEPVVEASEKTDVLAGVAEENAREAVLDQAAVQLREDALVIICLLSAYIDLFEADEAISLPLCTGLLHWATCESAAARDALPYSPVSPQQYSLEALCKMSVMEKNVDILLATPPWPRLEKLVETLVGLLSLAEETHCREFAIVLIHALCNYSVPLAAVAALRTPAVHCVVAFLEYVDSNMHAVSRVVKNTARRKTV